ncbi:MAG: biotin/lipoyl-binding protein [Pseudomonadota bacterium]
MGALAALGLSWVTYTPERIYEGRLQPRVTPLRVALPQGGVLQSLSVSEGQFVQAGETLALLDRGEMEARRSEAERQAILAHFTQQCLSQGDAPGYVNGLAQWVSDTYPAFAGDVSVRQMECRGRLDEMAAIADGFDARLAVLDARVALLRQQLALTLGPQATAEMLRSGAVGGSAGRADGTLATGASSAAGVLDADPVAPEIGERMQSAQMAQQALATLLERNAVQADRQSLQEARAVWQARATQALAEAADAAGAEHRTAEAAVARFDRLIAVPRVTAPAGGVIVRVRDPGRGYVSSGDGALVEVLRVGEQSFALSFEVDDRDARALTDGTPVLVTLGRGPGGTPADPAGSALFGARPWSPDAVGPNARQQPGSGAPGGGASSPDQGGHSRGDHPTLRGEIRQQPPDGLGSGAAGVFWVDLDAASDRLLANDAQLAQSGPNTVAGVTVSLPQQSLATAAQAWWDLHGLAIWPGWAAARPVGTLPAR